MICGSSAEGFTEGIISNSAKGKSEALLTFAEEWVAGSFSSCGQVSFQEVVRTFGDDAVSSAAKGVGKTPMVGIFRHFWHFVRLWKMYFTVKIVENHALSAISVFYGMQSLQSLLPSSLRWPSAKTSLAFQRQCTQVICLHYFVALFSSAVNLGWSVRDDMCWQEKLSLLSPRPFVGSATACLWCTSTQPCPVTLDSWARYFPYNLGLHDSGSLLFRTGSKHNWSWRAKPLKSMLNGQVEFYESGQTDYTVQEVPELLGNRAINHKKQLDGF